MRKLIVAAVLLLVSIGSSAYECFPSALLPQLGDGTAWRSTSVANVGYAKAWWCKLPVRAGDDPAQQYWQPQMLLVHKADESLVRFAAAAARVAAAADPLAQANLEIVNANVPLVPGTQKYYEYQLLNFTACKDLQVNPPLGVTFDPKPAGFAGKWVTDADWCGAAPTPPPPPVPSGWQVAANGTALDRPAFRVTNGVRSFSSAARAIVGSACDCASIKLVEGRSTYCQTAPAIVAICIPTPAP